MISQDLLKRLVYAKYIFWQGCEILDKKQPIADGMAVLNFQDAVELTLITIAEHVQANIKEKTPLDQIIERIEKETINRIPYKSFLIQLNKARVNFKHYGLAPTSEDVQKFRRDLDLFFPESIKLFFGLDFFQVSLADLIQKYRVKNYIKNAERELEEGKYKESITSAAIAFPLIFTRAIKLDHPDHLFHLKASPYKDRNFHEIIEILDDHENQLNILMYGINLAEYQRFKMYIPTVLISSNGDIMQVRYKRVKGYTLDNASFCLRFVTDTALLVQQNRVPDKWEDYYKEKFPLYRVVKKAPIIVSPSVKVTENIRDAEVGEVLTGYFENYNKDKYIAILHDDEIAYIQKDALEKIQLNLIRLRG